jgi:hypothetical protein
VGRAVAQTQFFYRSESEWDAFAERLKILPCPHCKRVGALICHGYLRGRDDSNLRQDTVRARRIFCSNRGKRTGCGRTFGVWIADKIRRLGLTARVLWQFLERVVSGTLADAIRNTTCHLCGRSMQRIWQRFVLAQSRIRTALLTLRPPPEAPLSQRPEAEVVAHLTAAFPKSQNPIAEFQAKTGTFFV